MPKPTGKQSGGKQGGGKGKSSGQAKILENLLAREETITRRRKANNDCVVEVDYGIFSLLCQPLL